MSLVVSDGDSIHFSIHSSINPHTYIHTSSHLSTHFIPPSLLLSLHLSINTFINPSSYLSTNLHVSSHASQPPSFPSICQKTHAYPTWMRASMYCNMYPIVYIISKCSFIMSVFN